MTDTRRRLILGAVASAAAYGAPSAWAQTYPQRPIRLIVPYAPGGTIDLVARIFSDALAKELGQPVIIENRAGGGGSIGTRALVESAPDGHVLMVGNIGTHGTNSAVYKNLPYDAVTDFTPITKLATFPGVIAVHPGFPASNFPEFLRAVRAAPGRYSYASSGLGAVTHLAMEQFKFLTNTFIVHVPYRGSGPALNDVVAGQVPILWDALPSALPFIRAGKLVAIGISAEQRSPQLPDVPTFLELGVKGYAPELWSGILGPPKMPADVVRRIHDAIAKVAELPSVKGRLEERGARITITSPEAFARSIDADVKRWRQIAQFARISLD